MDKRSILKVFVSFLALSIHIFTLHSFITKTSVFADAKFYFSITRSLIFDHNLLLGNEFFKLGLLKTSPLNDFIPTFYPPGTSFLWTTLYYIVYGLTNLMSLFFPNIRFNGYETVFEYSAGLVNIFLGIFSLFLIFKILSKYFSERISLLTVSALFLTTNLFFYIAVEPINSHSASFFVSTFFLFYFLNCRKEKHYYLTLGTVGGVAGLVRTQDLLLLILPAIQILSGSFLSPLRLRLKLKLFITHGLLLIVGIFIGFLPQIFLWKYFYNTFWYSPYIDTGFNFLNPQILHVLFNSQNGLFTTTPIILFALIGLLYKIVNYNKGLKISNMKLFVNWNLKIGIYISALFYFLLQLYLISSWNDYTQGGSYSIRMIISTYPLLAFGLAGVIEKVTQKIGDRSIVYIVGFFTVFNFLSIFIYLFKY